MTQLDDQQAEVIRGALLGDGHLDTRGTHPSLTVTNTKKGFLEWVQEKLKPIKTKTYLLRSAEEQANANKRSGWDENATREKYNDAYSIYTRQQEELEKFTRWYDEGIYFPDDLKLTKTSAKVWYASDGGLRWPTDHTAEVCITTKSQSNRPEYLESLFEEIGFSPKVYGPKIVFQKQNTRDFLKFLGEPIPGYEYKWEVKDRERYYELKEGDEYKNHRRRICEEMADKLGLSDKIADEAYESIKRVDIDKFGVYNTEQVCFCQVCLTANEHNIFIQTDSKYKELADGLCDYSDRCSIRNRLRNDPPKLG